MDLFFAAVEAGDLTKVRTFLAGDASLVVATDSRVKAPIFPRNGILMVEEIPPSAQKPRPPSLRTALHVAARNRRTEVARLLLDYGAVIDVVDRAGHTPLHDAVMLPEKLNLDLAQLLVKSGADVNTRGGSGGRTPLHLALQHRNGDLAVIEFLLISGAGVNARDKYGWAALDFPMFESYQSDQRALFEMLIRRGADVNAQPPTSGQYGWLLHRAVEVGKPEITKVLIEAGAKVNASFKNRGTALHAAARLGHADDVALLLAAGADASALDGEGRTPLELMKKHLEMIELLDRHALRRVGNGVIA